MTKRWILLKRLSCYLPRCGVMSPQSSEELHDKPLMIKVKVRPAQGEYEASNDVGGYKGVDVNDAPIVTPQQKHLHLPPAKNLGKIITNLAAHCGGFFLRNKTMSFLNCVRRNTQKQSVIVYGESGLGKTTFATSAPITLLDSNRGRTRRN